MFLGLLLLGYITFPVAMYLASSGARVPMDRYCDVVSFIVTPIAPYFISVGIYKNFKLNEEALTLFGDFCIGYA